MIHNISLLTFPFAPATTTTTTARGTPPLTSGLISASPESQPSFSDAKTQLTAFFQISAHASGAWRHPNTLVPIPIWDFYFDISEWHILSVRAWTPALMLHLTNPCAKRKVLSLTKSKGKIYKTKSLGHYITRTSFIQNPINSFHSTNFCWWPGSWWRTQWHPWCWFSNWRWLTS